MPEVEYIFKHALVQEAAYGSILAERRRGIHRRVAGDIRAVQRLASTALTVFNDAILRAAIETRAAVIDLRLVCAEPGDYAAVSPIEPSVAGGAKIAAAIARAMNGEGRASRVIT